ncbi:hypothetical protein E2C01_061467 [Portunus trituberculatus]|uniref:Uncharacterized protein n=1 Tax=Portunus trituberculatus TaxID=210409 RepID=A0A5B7HF40_PORTR|nr:hypothetical protein [Portunus trituberculatus]
MNQQESGVLCLAISSSVNTFPPALCSLVSGMVAGNETGQRNTLSLRRPRQHWAGAEASQKCLKSRSVIIGTQLSLQPQSVSKVTPSNSEHLHEENTMQDAVTRVKSSQVDASTNTTINFDKTKLIDLKVTDDIEKLLKEQEN